jgi:hypothetical protein
MAELGMTQRAFARLAGVSSPAITKAVRAGHLAVGADGRIDRGEPRNHTWLARHRPEAISPPPLPSETLTLENARLRTLEYEVLTRRAFYHEREQVAGFLHGSCDRILAGLQSFTQTYGPEMAKELGVATDPLLPRLQAAIDQFLSDITATHEVIDRALDGAAARWRRFPPDLPAGRRPPLPAFDPPLDLASCRNRMRAARNAMEEIRVRVRAGLLLADWPTQKAVGDIVIGVQQACIQFFTVRGDVQQVVADLGLDIHTLDMAMQRYMRRTLETIDREQLGDAAVEARKAAWEVRWGRSWQD